MENTFVASFTQVQDAVHLSAIEKGFWDNRWHLETLALETGDHTIVSFAKASTALAALALVVSEVSEAAEAIRKDNPPDDKIPAFSGAEAELADAIIRIMDLAAGMGWKVAQAIEEKRAFNSTRPHLHGKQL